MRKLAKDISYRAFYLALAVALIYILPTLAHLLGELVTAVFVPLLENSIQNLGNS